MSLLKVEELEVTFEVDGQPVEAVRKVSFELAEGETLAIVGESGSGKSVSAYSILQLLPLNKLSVFKGRIFFEGNNLMQDSSKLMERIRGNRIGMIFQDPMNSLNPTQTIYRQVSEAILLHQHKYHKRPDLLKKKVVQTLKLVELKDAEQFLSRFPHELSGGQKQRVMIAIALVNNPQLLIADEPTTALDVTVQAGILKLLQKLKKELNISILFITHDLFLVKELADSIVVMKEGKVVEHAKKEVLLKKPKHKFTRELFYSKFKIRKPVSNRKSESNLEKDLKLKRSFVEVEKLKVSFPIYSKYLRRKVGEVKAVQDISFSLPSSSTLGVIGESGSGKTTLALGLLQLITAEGKVRIDGTRLDGLGVSPLRSARREVQMVFQDSGSSLSPRMSVEEIIREGLDVHFTELSEKEKSDRIVSMMEEVGLSAGNRYKYPHEFSGGQRQRINLARALILNPRFLILDEPTSSLDFLLQIQVIDLLTELQKKHRLTYVFISHDLRVIKAISDEVMVMKNGECLEYGMADKILTNPQHPYTQQLVDAALK